MEMPSTAGRVHQAVRGLRTPPAVSHGSTTSVAAIAARESPRATCGVAGRAVRFATSTVRASASEDALTPPAQARSEAWTQVGHQSRSTTRPAASAIDAAAIIAKAMPAGVKTRGSDSRMSTSAVPPVRTATIATSETSAERCSETCSRRSTTRAASDAARSTAAPSTTPGPWAATGSRIRRESDAAWTKVNTPVPAQRIRVPLHAPGLVARRRSTTADVPATRTKPSAGPTSRENHRPGPVPRVPASTTASAAADRTVSELRSPSRRPPGREGGGRARSGPSRRLVACIDNGIGGGRIVRESVLTGAGGYSMR